MRNVYEDDDWSAVAAENGGDDEPAYLYDVNGDDITRYLDPDQILEAGLCNQAQYDYLIEQAKAKIAKDNARRAARLRAQADQLDPRPPQPAA